MSWSLKEDWLENESMNKREMLLHSSKFHGYSGHRETFSLQNSSENI